MVSQAGKDIIAGTAGGVAQVLVGQPFDLVKVRMQTAPQGTYSSTMACVTSVIKNEGPLAFYKGTLTPLLGIGVCVSIQFAALNSTKRFFAAQNGGSTELTAPQLFTSGAVAGLSNSIVSGPVEHVRIRLQTQPNVTPRLYAGPLDCIRTIYSAHGVRGLFKGQVPTLIREGLGYGSYFFAYEALMQRHLRQSGLRREDVSPGFAVLYGAAAGYALWATIYPFDVIKSKLQTDFFPSSNPGAPQPQYRSMADCFRQVWAKQGLKGFTNGLGPTLIRSPFANGATFVGFEIMMRALE